MANEDVQSNQPRRKRWKSLVLLAGLIGLLGVSSITERLFYHPAAGPTPLPSQPPNGQAVTFESGDGTRLNGWWFPADPPDPDASTVVHIHGNAGSIADHLGFSDFLPRHGFNLFIFDYRGYGESEGSARRRGPLIEDGLAAVDLALTRSDQVLIYGQSLGGAIGLNVMAERPQIVAGVFVSAFASWQAVAADAVGGTALSRALAWLLIRDGSRPDEALRSIDRPVLLLHGDRDTIVPHHHLEQLVAARPDVAHETLVGGDHNGLLFSHPQMRSTIVAFYREAIQSPPVPSPGAPP